MWDVRAHACALVTLQRERWELPRGSGRVPILLGSSFHPPACLSRPPPPLSGVTDPPPDMSPTQPPNVREHLFRKSCVRVRVCVYLDAGWLISDALSALIIT